MSAVLRKKIEARAGVPPSVLQLQSFWETLEEQVGGWARDCYGVEGEASLARRRVVHGPEALKTLESQSGFFFSAEASPGLAAVAIDTAGAVQNAAIRMKQPADGLSDASPLFLKLLSEQAATGLGERIAERALNSAMGFHPLTSEPSQAASGFDETARYLQVEYHIDIDGTPSGIWLFHPFEFVQTYMRTYAREMADQKIHSRHNIQKRLSDSVRASTVVVDAVLDRVSLTIGECFQLQVGSVVTLSGADTAQLLLTTDTLNGGVDIGSGELGVWKTQRAIKLNTPILESFAQELADL